MNRWVFVQHGKSLWNIRKWIDLSPSKCQTLLSQGSGKYLLCSKKLFRSFKCKWVHIVQYQTGCGWNESRLAKQHDRYLRCSKCWCKTIGRCCVCSLAWNESNRVSVHAFSSDIRLMNAWFHQEIFSSMPNFIRWQKAVERIKRWKKTKS